MMKHVFSKKNRALLTELVRTDFKLRYQNSVLGYLWSLLRPLLLFLTLYIIFVKVMNVNYNVPHSGVYLLLGIVVWSFFAEMTSLSVGSIVGRGDLIRKIRIPRWSIVVSSSMSALINLGLNLVIVGVFMLIDQVPVMWSMVLLPLVLVELYLFALGLSLFLSAAFVKYRDISYIWEVLMQLLFYATPIIFPISFIKNAAILKIMFLSPLTQAIQDARFLLISHDTTTIADAFGTGWARLIPVTITICTLVFGTWYFKRESKYFAENI